MTTLVSGDLKIVTDQPGAVTEVWVRAAEPRLQGTAYVTDGNDHIQVQGGWVEFEALDGPAVMMLVSGGMPIHTVKMIIPDTATATLRECIQAVGLVDEGTLDTLTALAQEVAAAAANSFQDWEALQEASEAAATAASGAKASETNAAQSASAAKTSETRARNAAQASATSASNAKTSETNAKTSETTAATSANSARNSASNAATSETSAGNSATSASTAASDALTIKNSIPSTVQSEVDDRVPPKVAEVIAGDTVVTDAAAAAVEEALTDANVTAYGGFISGNQDLNTAALGNGPNTRVYYSTGYDTANSPTPHQGIVDVMVSENNRQFIQTFYRMDGPGIWKREITDRRHVGGTWEFQEWIRTDQDSRVDLIAERLGAPLPQGADFNALTTPRTWQIPVSGMLWPNQPAEGPGTLKVDDTGNGTGVIQVQEMTTTNPVRVFRRFRNSGGNWQPWSESGRHDVNYIDPGAGRRDTIVEAGLQRRGRVIGTGGKAAIALRFDHHLNQFGTRVLPLLKKYRLPWGQMLNPGNMGSGNDTWSWAQVAQEAHRSGGEVWNHSWSHANVAHPVHADAQITNALVGLRNNLPSLWIDAWAPPGQPNYLGYEGQDTAEKHWDTYPGKLILAQHAFVRGYYPGIYQPLSGPNLVGAGHATIDRQTAAWCEAAIRGARDAAAGFTLMLHPNYLDQSGYMSTSDLDQVLGYIAQLRDRGEIVVLSNAGVLMADADVPVRQGNMLSGAGAGTVTSSWSQEVTSRVWQAHVGVPHEAEAWVVGSGEVKLTVWVDSPTYPVTSEHTVTLSAGSPQRLSAMVTPPMDTTGITVTLTGNVRHTGIIYRPI